MRHLRATPICKAVKIFSRSAPVYDNPRFKIRKNLLKFNEKLSIPMKECILDPVSAYFCGKIFSFLRYLSEKPHVAASPRNNELANEYERRFKAYGFDEVEKLTYNVLLSYPNQSQPNYAYILNNTKGVNFRTQYMEDILDPAEDSPDAYQPFNAFGLAATVTVSGRNLFCGRD